MGLFVPASAPITFVSTTIREDQSFALDDVTLDTFVTIGKTGDGYDYEWNALDSVPTGSTGIYVSAWGNAAAIAVGNLNFLFYACESTHVATGALSVYNYQARATAIAEVVHSTGTAWIPLADGAISAYLNLFNANYWDGASMHLIGFV